MLHWGVYFIIASNVFRTLGTTYVAGVTLNQAVIILLFLAAIPYRLLKEKRFYQFAVLDVALVLFGLYLWVSNFLISPDPSWGMRVATDYLRSLTCYFLVVFLITDEKKVRWFIYTYIATSLAMVLTADVLGAVQTGIHFTTQAREGLTGEAGHYINYAIYALMSIPLAYFLMKNYRNLFAKTVLWAIIGILTLSLLFSGSRGAVLAFGIMVVAILFMEIKQFSRIKPLQLVTLTVLSIGLFVVFWIKGGSELLGTLLSALTGGGKMDASLAGRLSLNQSSWALFLENPVFGTGADTTRHILKNVTHNQWLQILAELGVIGMSLALFATLSLYRCLRSPRGKADYPETVRMANMLNGASVSVFVLLIWGFYENIGFIHAYKVLFMLFALLRVMHIIMKNRRETIRKPVLLHAADMKFADAAP